MSILIIFILGACIGSFFNVCIYRIPLNESIIFPKSHCPSCDKPIPFYFNIPIISYISLRGKCAFCGAEIPIRYLIVEVLTPIFIALIFIKFKISLPALSYAIFISGLIIISFIDIKEKIIPDVISIPWIIIGFISSFFSQNISYKESLLGIILGAGVLLFIRTTYKLTAKKEGMGIGDIKLLGMIGAFIGVKGVFFTLFTSSLAGSLYALFMLIFSDKKIALNKEVPFGPFLSLGAVLYVFYGNFLIKLWLSII